MRLFLLEYFKYIQTSVWTAKKKKINTFYQVTHMSTALVCLIILVGRNNIDNKNKETWLLSSDNDFS